MTPYLRTLTEHTSTLIQQRAAMTAQETAMTMPTIQSSKERVVELKEQITKTIERVNQLREVIANHKLVVEEYQALVGTGWSNSRGQLESLRNQLKITERMVDLAETYPNAVLVDGTVSPNVYVTKVTPKRVYFTVVHGANSLVDGYYQQGQYNYHGLHCERTQEAYNNHFTK